MRCRGLVYGIRRASGRPRVRRQSATPPDIGEEIRRLQRIQSELTAIYIAINEEGDFDAADASVTCVHIEAALSALDRLDSF